MFASAQGYDELVWSSKPIGAYKADSATDACKAAAADVGAVGTFFAVEGVPWGVSMMKIDNVVICQKPSTTKH